MRVNGLKFPRFFILATPDRCGSIVVFFKIKMNLRCLVKCPRQKRDILCALILMDDTNKSISTDHHQNAHSVGSTSVQQSNICYAKMKYINLNNIISTVDAL